MRSDAGFRLPVAASIAIGLLNGACAPPAQKPENATARRAEHVLLLTIDTLRADRVGAYGYVTAHTPTLDGLARDGVRFDRPGRRPRSPFLHTRAC
jgi:predicted AlkP superfamily pyrophosphatase or phosphodiesterase